MLDNDTLSPCPITGEPQNSASQAECEAYDPTTAPPGGEERIETTLVKNYGIQYSNRPPHFASEDLTMTFERETRFGCGPEAVEKVKRLARD